MPRPGVMLRITRPGHSQSVVQRQRGTGAARRGGIAGRMQLSLHHGLRAERNSEMQARLAGGANGGAPRRAAGPLITNTDS